MNIRIDKTRKSPYFIEYTIDKKRRREFFKTRAEAKSRAAEINQNLAENGVKSFFFDPSDRADYEECKRLMAKFGLQGQVSTILSRALENEQNRAIPKKFDDAYEEYYELKDKMHREDSTLKTIIATIRPFCREFETQKLICELTKSDVIKYMATKNKLNPRTCRNIFSNICTFLNYCHEQNWLSFEPRFNKKAILPREEKKPIEIYKYEVIKGFFEFLEKSRYRDYCSFFALQAFAGVRRAEAERLVPEKHINYEEKSIFLSSDITKTKDFWLLNKELLPANIWKWLKKYPKIVFPSYHMRLAMKRDWGGTWIHNGLRHAYATMYVSLKKDPGKTALALRHQSEKKLWSNYMRLLVPSETAKAYFSIVPKK